MRQDKITADIEIQNLSNIGVDLGGFIHQDIWLNAEGPVFDFLQHLLVLFAIGLVQLVQDGIVDHFEDMFQVILCCSLIKRYESDVDGVFGGLLFAFGKQHAEWGHLW